MWPPRSEIVHAELFTYRKAPELATGEPGRYRVAIVGAGPVGLCMAIDLAQHGIDTVLLDEDDKASEGSRAICFAKRTLEILDRLGVGQRSVDKGVVWNVGKVFLHDRRLYQFDLLPESGHKRPAFINLQQYYLEEFLVERLLHTGRVDLRWRNRVAAVAPRADAVAVSVTTPDGEYALECDYLIAADGSRSLIRTMLGLEAKGQVFRDRFLIADVKMQAPFPTERWFWFDPPFHPNQSVLLHRQADDVWRIDFQLGWDADPEAERRPERVIPRIQAMLGTGHPFELEWVSVYTFRCQRMERFRHGRVFFVGDSAHQVSPFGARGANSGIQDADNLAWKLALVLEGLATDELLDSYDAERIPAADENILNSTRSTDFITPKSAVSRTFRDAALQLAEKYPFARKLVNSGRLSLPHTYRRSPLDTPDRDSFGGRMAPGAPALDAPLGRPSGRAWLLDQLGGSFVAVYYLDGHRPPPEDLIEGLKSEPVAVEPIVVCAAGAPPTGLPADVPVFVDTEGLFAERYDAAPGSLYLFRPDQHLTARWRHLDLNAVRSAVLRAACLREGVAA
jgi:3-(3-hydroxy-phenyl)propionate hydroxylase